MAPPRRRNRSRRRGALARLALGGVLVAVSIALAIRARDPGPPPGRAGDGDVRVVTYNIRAALGGLDALAAELERLAPDLVALQEVEHGLPRSRSRDQAGELADALGFRPVFAGSFPVDTGEHGIAVLSRWPIEETEIVRLPQGSGRWPRVALKARVRAPDGPLLFVCVHLARPWGWPLSNTRARLAQLEELRASLSGEDGRVIVAGDFNSVPFSPEHRSMSRLLADSWDPWRDGWAASFPLTVIGWPGGAVPIDRIFHGDAWESRGVWVAPPGASDHRALVADLVPVRAARAASVPTD